MSTFFVRYQGKIAIQNQFLLIKYRLRRFFKKTIDKPNNVCYIKNTITIIIIIIVIISLKGDELYEKKDIGINSRSGIHR